MTLLLSPLRKRSFTLVAKLFALLVIQAFSFQAMSEPGVPNDTTAIYNAIISTRKLDDNDPGRAIDTYKALAEQSARICYTNGQVYALHHMANVCLNHGENEQAIRYFLNCIDVLELHGDRAGVANIYTGIAVVLIRTGEVKKSFYYLDTAEKIGLQLKRADILDNVYSDKSFAYSKLGDYGKIRYYSLAALDAAKQSHNASAQCVALVNLTSTYVDHGEPRVALKYILMAMQLKDKVNSNCQCGIMASLGEVYFKLHDSVRATYYLHKSLTLSEKAGNIQNMLQVHDILSEFYAAHNNYRQSLAHYKSFVLLKDSMDSKARVENENQLEIKYRTAQKDKAIADQQLVLNTKESKLKERTSWIWGIALSSAILLVSLLILFRSYQRKQQLQTTIISNMKQEQKISHLTATIQAEERERTRIARELHDGVGGLLSAAKMNFNSLHHLYDESPVFHNGISLLDEAYDQLRKTAHNLLPETLLQGGLVKAVRAYCNMIGRQALDITFHSLGNIPRFNAETELSLYRIIQELVNNILKHAHATKALVEINMLDDNLLITVEDNGTGIAGRIGGDDAGFAVGIGMKSLASRIEVLGGQMDIDSRMGIGTTVYLEFDILKFQITEVI